MLVEAIYNRGKLEFSKPIQLTSHRFPVLVELPDGVIKTETETEIKNQIGFDEKASRPHIMPLLDELSTILDAPLPTDDDLPELTENQKERIEAFTLREKFRQEQGRPA